MAQRDFNDIYLGVRARVYRLATGILGNREDAEDVVQDLYEKLWRRRWLVVAGHNPEGYILAGARNLCIDRLRRRKPQVEVTKIKPVAADGGLGGAGDSGYADFGGSGGLDGTGTGEGETGQIVRRLVAALPEKQRTVMLLHDIECMETGRDSGDYGVERDGSKNVAFESQGDRERETCKNYELWNIRLMRFCRKSLLK